MEVGVLLPARLETRFYPPTGARPFWQLRVLIVPDEASIDRHNPHPTPDEIASVELLWQTAPNGLPDLDFEPGQSAWRAFVDRHGGARAAWLARTFPPLAPDPDGTIRVAAPAEFHDRTRPRFPELQGVPSQLEIWMARAGNPPQRIASTLVERDRLQLDFPNPDDPEDERWWTSWQRAVDVGLGVVIELEAIEPTDIDALYVLGLGDDEPTPLFLAHRDSGNLAVVAPGAPTNTVDGELAIPLAFDVDTWLAMAQAPEKPNDGSSSAFVSRALTGQPDRLGTLLQDDFTSHDPAFPYDEPGRRLMGALWPVVFGHALKDVWGLGQSVQAAGVWAERWVRPEGPFPPIRIGAQPYGLLPATSLELWQPGDGDAPDPDADTFQQTLQVPLLDARANWEGAADVGGTVVNAETELLLSLIGRTPSSRAYAYRWFQDIDLLRVLYAAFVGGDDPPHLDDWWNETSKALTTFGVSPQRRYVSTGWPQDLQIPLVAPEDVSLETTFGAWLDLVLPPLDVAKEFIIEWHIDRWVGWAREIIQGPPSRALPASLLLRLILHSVWVSAANVFRASQGNFSPALEPVAIDDSFETRLHVATRESAALSDAEIKALGFPEADLYWLVRDAIQAIFDIPVGRLELAMRAILDTASHRIDPWITAYASRRLTTVDASHTYRLGLYGWVDAPRPGAPGTLAAPGPTVGGLLHAPSEQQVLTAAILRDKAIHDPQTTRWAINLESDAVRTAQEIAEEVRLGTHLSEVLGRRVERIVGDRATIQTLREDEDRRFSMRDEHGARRVCDGLKVLTLLATNPGAVPLSDEQKDALVPLQRAVDAYGDLLVAEAVHHVVAGRGAVAGAAMDAAAGLAGPPDLEVISTLRSGRAVTTNVVAMLPSAEDPPLANNTSPGRVADPAVAAFLERQLGLPDTSAWHWQVAAPGGALRDVFLADLGLVPIDTAVLSEEDLAHLVLAHIPEATWVGDPMQNAGSKSHSAARQLVELLGSQPALPEDLVDDGSDPDDAAVREELRERLSRLFELGVMLRGALDTTDETEARDALAVATRWGIIPMALTDDPVQARAQRARGALIERLGRTAFAVTPEDAQAAINAETDTVLTIDEGHASAVLATTIAELAAPEGQIAVLSRIDLAGWPTTFLSDKDLDDQWLPVVAAVRPPLVRLEVHQMEADDMIGRRWPPLSRWSNRPLDPWQREVLEHQPGTPVPASRFIAVYGPEDVFDPANQSTRVAAGLLDGWGETIPAKEQTTAAAFGFNAPAARAPQAILLAVPPIANEPLSTDILAQIVGETRRLVRARMATQDDLRQFGAALPLIMLPATGETMVELAT